MLSDLIDRYGGPVPRYTSYPTAPHFTGDVGAAQYDSWLAELPADQPVSMYLHVPYCARMCWYCGCHTKVVKRYDPIQDYARTLIAELELVAARVDGPLPVAHLHWGGGTPTMLTPDDFARVMERIHRRYRIEGDAELAVEIDPRTLTEDMTRALAATGINRVSLGIQDFNEHVQRSINRVQPFDLTRRCVDQLRDAGIAAINLDLMYGLPHQGLEQVLQTVDLAVRLEPDRISLFGYAHVPWMKTHQRMIDETALPGAVERWQQAESAAERLAEYEFRRIGLDHFARRDDAMTAALDGRRLRRNFQGYTDDAAETLLGFGASAIGSLPRGYVQNDPSVSNWRRAVEAQRLPIVRGLELAPDDRLRRRVIERLMCDLAVDLADFSSEPGAPDDAFQSELRRLEPLASDGLIELGGDRIRVTDTGRPFVRSVCAAFDTYLGTGRGQHSQAV